MDGLLRYNLQTKWGKPLSLQILVKYSSYARKNTSVCNYIFTPW